MKNITIIAFFSLLFAGCEKTIELDYKANQSQIIIEGNISNGPGPYFVKISKSIGLSDLGDYPTVDNAAVAISDDAGKSETLVFEGNGVYRTTSITGVEGRTYTLTVEAEGQTYTAQSTMPQQVPFDSIKVEEVELLGGTEYNIIPIYLDPIAKGNNYRFELSINGEIVKQHLIQSDEIRNGVANTLRLELNDDDLALNAGDTITLMMQCIDENVASFYTALILMEDNGPGGGTTPSNPPNNITGNGALGIFSAYTTQTKTAIIQ